MLDSASAEKVAAEMVLLGILEKKSSEPLYRVAVRHQSNRPFRKELYQMTTGTRAGLSRESFISKLFSTDELYTRVLEDVISGEAKGQIRYRRLTPFAKEQVDERRRGTEF